MILTVALLDSVRFLFVELCGLLRGHLRVLYSGSGSFVILELSLLFSVAIF